MDSSLQTMIIVNSFTKKLVAIIIIAMHIKKFSI
jgi:hypothetical protein